MDNSYQTTQSTPTSQQSFANTTHSNQQSQSGYNNRHHSPPNNVLHGSQGNINNIGTVSWISFINLFSKFSLFFIGFNFGFLFKILKKQKWLKKVPTWSAAAGIVIRL